MSEYKLKTGKLGEKVVDGYKVVENTVVGGYKKIEGAFEKRFLNEDGTLKTGKMSDTAVNAYKKIENGVVGTYKKIENAFVDTFLDKTEQPDDKTAAYRRVAQADEKYKASKK